MLKINLKTHQHLSSVMHKDFNHPAIVVRLVILNWKLHLEFFKFVVRCLVIMTLQVEQVVVLLLSMHNFVFLFVTSV